MLKEMVMLLVAKQLDPLGQLLEKLKSVKPMPLLPLRLSLSLSFLAISLLLLLSPTSGQRNMEHGECVSITEI
jgi:hypothetical protein